MDVTLHVSTHMKTDEQIRKHVMRRVWAMYWARELKKPAPRIALLGALTIGLASSVSIANVVMNVPYVSGFSGMAAFFVTAFVSTTAAVQAMTVALLGSVGWFIADAFRKVRTAVLPAHETATAQ